MSARTIAQLAIDSTRTGTWDWHIPSGRVETNGWYNSMLGEPARAATITLDAFFHRVHPDDQHALHETVRTSHESEEGAYDTRFRMQHADGGYAYIRSLGQVIERDQHGNPIRMLGIHIDMTQDLESRERLAASEREARKLSLIAERTSSGVIVTDRAGKVTWANRAFTAVSGYTLDEVRGRSPGSVLQCERTCPQVVARIRKALDACEPIECEIRNRAKCGRLYWLNLDIDPIFEDGECVGYMAIETDITERKEREEQYRLAVERLDEAQRVGGVGSWHYNLITDELSWSAYLFEMFDKDPALGTPDVDTAIRCYNDESIAKLTSAFAAAVTAGIGYTLRLTTRGDNGPVREIEAVGKVRCDDEGNPVAVYGTARDITEQVEYERALQHATDKANAASRAKSEFLANMSHEIRTPMTAILGFSELLQESDNTEDRASYIHTIQRNGEHLLALINDVLDLARIESGKVQIESTSFDLRAILDDAANVVRGRAEENGVDLVSDIHPDVPRAIIADPTRVRQVIVNLLANAVKFTKFGGVTTRVTCLSSGEQSTLIRVEVEDSGAGIPSDRHEAVFKSFEQADSSTVRQFGGTGLGLSIGRKLARAMGGDIRIVRSTPGLGSTFAFDFRADIAHPDHHGTSPESTSQTGTRTTSVLDTELTDRRVLLVEDGVDNQRLISFMLRRLGANVELASNGIAAIERYTEQTEAGEHFDLILMDMQMPVMDGYTATRTLRQSGCATPIIALTANAMVGDKEKCLQAGCTDFLTKPVTKAELASRCAAHIGLSDRKTQAA